MGVLSVHMLCESSRSDRSNSSNSEGRKKLRKGVKHAKVKGCIN